MTRRPRFAGELLVAVVLLFVYDYVAGLAKVRAEAAFQHGRDLLALSPWDLEHAANVWFAGAPTWLHKASAYYYDLAHINVTFGVLLLCYALRPRVYRRARNALLAINLMGMAVFLLYPVAPPRLLPGSAFVDIVATSHTFGAWETGGGVANRANEFGSMPSLHLAWAVWVALTVLSMTERRVARTLAWGHVVMTSVIVILTGNHYLLDLAAGAAVAALAWAATPYLALRRSPAPLALAD